MAKRAAPDEKPYRPVAESLVRAVMRGGPAAVPEPADAEPPEPERADPLPPRAGPAGRIPSRPDNSPEPDPALPDPRPAEPAPARRERPAPPPSAEVVKLDREKRVLMTGVEERSLERVVAAMGEGVNTALKLSHVLRACVTLLLNAEDELVQRARKHGRLVRPPNGDAAALARFDRAVAQILSAALRDARPLR